MCECNLKENLELAEQEMSAMTRTIIEYENEIDRLNKKIDLQELIIALRDKEIQELNIYIDPDCDEDEPKQYSGEREGYPY